MKIVWIGCFNIAHCFVEERQNIVSCSMGQEISDTEIDVEGREILCIWSGLARVD
jgi:hypothetical protein